MDPRRDQIAQVDDIDRLERAQLANP